MGLPRLLIPKPASYGNHRYTNDPHTGQVHCWVCGQAK